jgi:broad specificity phosphatase PhoE
LNEVVLARHAETETSVRGIVGGDAPLTETGRAQARALGRALAPLRLDVCLTSEARRARETADLALEGRQIPRELLPDLGDMDFGTFAGAPLESYRAWIAAHPPAEAPTGGESRVETLRRFARGFRAVLARPERVVLVVAHGLALRAVLDERPRPEVTGVPYASSIRVSRAELQRAVERLDAWCEAPAW